MKARISVVIPTYNSWQTLKKSISSIKSQTLKAYEIIVIDNASTDGTLKNVKSFFPDVKVSQMHTNTGVSGGRNRGIKLANKSTDYIFFFDHDMYAGPNMLEMLVKVSESDKLVGITTPKIFYYKDKKRIWSAGTGINLWTGQVLFRAGVDKGQFENIEEVQVAPAALLVKKEVLEKITGFDTKYFATYEDTDFCFRTKKAGYKTYYVPKSVAYHDLPIDLKTESIRLLSRTYWVGKNRVLFMRDFGKSFVVFLMFLPIFCLYYLKLSIKYHDLPAWRSFMKGTIDGLFY